MKSISACRSCKAPIIFVETQHGRLMPVDAEPTQEGSFDLVEDGQFTFPDGRVRIYKPDDPPFAFYRGCLPPLKRYLPHFATCPNAAEHRKKGKRTP